MTFKLFINTDNDVFATSEGRRMETARILRDTANRVESGDIEMYYRTLWLSYLHLDPSQWRSDATMRTITADDEHDHNGYYQGPLGIETDRPQIWDSTFLRLIVIAIASLGLWAAISAGAILVSSLIPPA